MDIKDSTKRLKVSNCYHPKNIIDILILYFEDIFHIIIKDHIIIGNQTLFLKKNCKSSYQKA